MKIRAHAFLITIAHLVADHQAELADYNVLVELMNMDSDRSLVDGEFEELKHTNGKEALLVEKLFLNRKEKENEVQEIESQIEQVGAYRIGNSLILRYT